MTQVREPITAPRGLGWVELVFCVLAIHGILAGSSLYSQEESVPPGVPPPPTGSLLLGEAASPLDFWNILTQENTNTDPRSAILLS